MSFLDFFNKKNNKKNEPKTDINNYMSWDEDDYYDELDEDEEAPLAKLAQKDRKESAEKAKVFLLITAVFCVLLLLVFIIVSTLSGSSNEYRDQFKAYKTVPNEDDGRTKLKTPFLGTVQDARTQAYLSTLPNAEQFDFSPLESNSIEKTAVLPQKFATSEKKNEFEELLKDPSQRSTERSFTPNEYEKMSLDELQNVSISYLPRWQQNSSKFNNSKVTDKQGPVFALVLSFDPNELPLEALPNAPLTIALESSEKVSQELVNDLRSRGYEVILKLPIQEDGKLGVSIGTYPIKENMPFESMRKAIEWHTTHLIGIIGFMNKNVSNAMASQADMNYMMNLLSQAGMTFLEVVPRNDNHKRIIAYAAASGAGMPAHKADQMIKDLSIDFPIFFKKIARLKKGVAVMDVDKQNIKLLEDILSKIHVSSLRMVPLSTIYAQATLPSQFNRF